MTRGQIGTPAVPPAAHPEKLPPLDVPPGLPGADAPFPSLPPDTPVTRSERLRVLAQLFPDLPDIGPDPVVDGTAGARPVAVEELIARAKQTSPTIAQAAADVEDARGRWVQAGLYPNPMVGYQADQVANQGTAGQQGGFIEQPIVVSGRLKIARAVAQHEYITAKLRLRRAEVELTRQVREDFYAAAVAAEQVRVTRLVSFLSEELFRRQVALVKGGQSAPFEGAAVRGVVGQSRSNVVAARNRYVSAWKRLAATLNDPDLPPAPLAGRIDDPAPRFRFDALRDRLLATHTDLAVAQNQIAQAVRTVSQEQVRPIPDLQNHFYFQNDNQLDSFQLGIQLGAQIPVYNRNQGAILSAKAQLARAEREVERVRNDLLRQLADAYERYETTREQLALYQEELLPDSVREFRGVNARYQADPGAVNYNDIVSAQQNLAARLADYLQFLRQHWQALADLTGIVQADRVEELGAVPDAAVPDAWPIAVPRFGSVALPAPKPLPK